MAMDITTNNRLETVPQRKYVLAGYTRYVHFCSLVWTSCFYPDKKQISKNQGATAKAIEQIAKFLNTA